MANDAAYLANVLGQCRQASLECDVDEARDVLVEAAVAWRDEYDNDAEETLALERAVDAYLRAKEAAEKES